MSLDPTPTADDGRTPRPWETWPGVLLVFGTSFLAFSLLRSWVPGWPWYLRLAAGIAPGIALAYAWTAFERWAHRRREQHRRR